MRIKSISVTEHPILGTFRYDDFDLETNKKDIATFFVGANGSGKSFFLEAVVQIFQTVFEEKKCPYDFTIEIADAGSICTIKGKRDKKPTIEIPNGKEANDFLPKNLLFYYSGETKRAAEYFQSYFTKNKREIIKGGDVALPAFFYVDPSLTDSILLTLLVYQPEFQNSAVWKHTGIQGVERVRLFINPQNWYQKNFENYDDANTKFWGALGELSRFSDLLSDASADRKSKRVEFQGEEYNFINELTLYPADFEIIRQRITSPKRFFELLVNLKASDLLGRDEIVLWKINSEKRFLAHNLSEGEKQLLLVLGFIELAQKEKTLFLIDEPDTHLNPLWKYHYMKNLQEVITTDPKNIELFVCSHDPLLISGLEAEQVIFIERENDNLKLSQAEDDLMGKGVEAILTSHLFGLATTLDYKTNEKFLRRRVLIAKGVSKKLSKQELNELSVLTAELRGIDLTIPYNDPAFVDFLAQIDEHDITGYSEPFNRANRYDVRQKAKQLFKTRPNEAD